MGGKTGIFLALKYPDLLQSLIVIDIGLHEYKRNLEHLRLFKLMTSIALEKFKKREDIEKHLKNKIRNSQFRGLILKNLGQEKPGGKFFWRPNIKAIQKNYNKILEGINSSEVFEKPVLFIKGEKSDYLLPVDVKPIKKHFTNSEIITVANAGHWVHTENPEEFYFVVRKFLL